jgi:magnesium chelatase subunit I
MRADPSFSLLPYSLIVGLDSLRRALEIGFVDRRIGVLVTGKRGTAKSTMIRSFAVMAFGELPVTLPIGVTDDRVLGGWRLDTLVRAKTNWQAGLIEKASASASRMLYVDEINLLDDHVVNIILDAASTGILHAHRDGSDRPAKSVQFALVGTMNPDEGWLRPQLLDRFGLVVMGDVSPQAADQAIEHRRQVLANVLRFDEAHDGEAPDRLAKLRESDRTNQERLLAARRACKEVQVGEPVMRAAARLAHAFEVEGHRGEVTLIRAARAVAALDGAPVVTSKHLSAVAELSFVHRRPHSESGMLRAWTDADRVVVADVLGGRAG